MKRPLDIERFKQTCRSLVASARELNAARNELRRATDRLAGAPLEGWSMEDLCDWVDLFAEQHTRIGGY